MGTSKDSERRTCVSRHRTLQESAQDAECICNSNPTRCSRRAKAKNTTVEPELKMRESRRAAAADEDNDDDVGGDDDDL